MLVNPLELLAHEGCIDGWPQSNKVRNAHRIALRRLPSLRVAGPTGIDPFTGSNSKRHLPLHRLGETAKKSTHKHKGCTPNEIDCNNINKIS